MRRLQKTSWLLPFFCLLISLAGHAQDGCPNPPVNVEATPLPTPKPDPKAWDAGEGIGVILDADGKPAKNDDGTPKLNGRMTAPQNQTGPQTDWKRVFVAPGAKVPCAVEGADDWDHWIQKSNDPCVKDGEGVASDSVNYKWSASSGSLESDSSTSTTWTAPDQPGTYTLTCKIDDKPTEVVKPETGDRDDGAKSVTCVVEVTDLSVKSDKSTICAGGVSSKPHQTIVTATLKDNEGKARPGIAVSFSVENSDTDYPASISAASDTTDEKGEAHTTLTSSTLVDATAIVKAEADGMKGESEKITMGEAGATWGAITPDELIADGESQADVPVSLTFGSDAVDGHSLSWRIIKLYNDQNALIYDESNPTLSTNPGGYGSITSGSPAEDPKGTYHGTYTVGTKAGTIVFQYTDETVYEDAPNATTAPVAQPNNQTLNGAARGAAAGPAPPIKGKKTHPKGDNSKDSSWLKFHIEPDTDGSSQVGSTGTLDGVAESYAFYLTMRAHITLPGDASHPPKLDPIQFKFTPRNGGASFVQPARLIRSDETFFTNDKPSTNAGRTTWTYVSDRKNISVLFDRYDITVQDTNGTTQKSNQVNYKTDKRGQILDLAGHWILIADFKQYPTNGPIKDATFTACDSFVNYIYGSLGLPQIGLSFASGVTDSGNGALVFFQTKNGYPVQTPPFTAASHVGIVSGSNRVDNNSYNNGDGPTLRDIGEGTGNPMSPIAQYWNNYITRVPVGASGKSILQEFDGY